MLLILVLAIDIIGDGVGVGVGAIAVANSILKLASLVCNFVVFMEFELPAL